MNIHPYKLNPEVSKFLDDQNHPLRMEIEVLRIAILDAHADLLENIKWNGPNYTYLQMDRITMKIHPTKHIQLIFHRGVKILQPLKENLIEDPSGLLLWRAKDRAIATFTNIQEILKNQSELVTIIKRWIEAAKK